MARRHRRPARGADADADALPLATLRLVGGDGWTRSFGAATSGTSVHRWQLADGRANHHLIDRRTGRPADTDVVQATVVAPTAREAEMIAKTAVILGCAARVSVPDSVVRLRGDPAARLRRSRGHAGDREVAGVKYEGLSPRTRLLRWGLFLLAVGGVLVATGPDAVRAAADWLAAHSDSLAWYSSRILGFLAYGALAISVIYGLLLSTGFLDRVAHRAVSLTLHQDLSAIAIGLTALHGALLALDTFVPQTVRQLVIPFSGPYRPEWVGHRSDRRCT